MKNRFSEIWDRYSKNIFGIVMPHSGHSSRDIEHWKNKVFSNILIYILPLSILALVPGMITAFKENMGLLAIYDVVAFGLILFISLTPGLQIKKRKLYFIGCLYGLSVMLIYYLALFGPAMLYLLALTVITCVIFSARAAYFCVFLNATICLLLGLAIYSGYPAIPLTATYTIESWIAVTSNLILLNLVCTACLNLLIKGFETTLLERKEVEEKILLNEGRLRKAQEIGQLGYWQLDIGSDLIWASEQAMKIYGLPAKDGYLERDKIAPFVPEIKKVRQAAIDLYTKNIKYDITFAINPANGGPQKIIWAVADLERDAEGKALRITGVLQDITESKKAADNIRDSEEKRRLIMNAALDAIICINTKGEITFWNPQAENIFGWPFEEVDGRRLSDIIIPSKYRQMHDQGMANYLVTGHGPALNVLLELHAVKRDGTEFPIELTVLPIKQGKEEFFCAFIRDISKRKKR